MTDENKNIDDGEPVYACACENGHQQGISRRDWLAGLAMQGMIAGKHNLKYDKNFEEENLAWQSYKYADAMIAEGKKNENL